MCHLMTSSCYSGGSQWQYFVGTVLFSYIQDAVISNGNVEKVVTTGYNNSKEQSVEWNSEWGRMYTAGVHRFLKIVVTISKF